MSQQLIYRDRNLRDNDVWWYSPKSVISLDSQQAGELGQAVQLLGWNVRRLVVSSQQVSPDVLLLQAGEEVLDLEHHAQPPPLSLHLRHLLPLHRLLLGPQQLQDYSRSIINLFLNYHCRHLGVSNYSLWINVFKAQYQLIDIGKAISLTDW